MFGLSRDRNNILFCKVDWHSVTEHQKTELKKEIDHFDTNKLLNTSTQDLIEYFIEKYSINVPVLQEDQISVDDKEAQIDVSHDQMRYISDRSRPFYITGTQIEVDVPFTGDAEVFRIQPTTFSLSPPRANIKGSSLIIVITGTDLQPEQLRKDIERTVGEIKENLGRLTQSATQFNISLREITRNHIEFRKQKLLKDRNLVANLGFPMKKRDTAPQTYAAPEVKKKISPPTATANSKAYEPEPMLPEADYENILTIMERMVHVMECSPAAFHHMDEEGIRTHFLVQLNGQYEGQATGETFNFEGKTDILIKSSGRNIFIAECKFWIGAKKYTDTIDQLLSYLSWRDTKASIIIFNRNKNFSNVIDEIKKTTPEHLNYKGLISMRSETSMQYRFAHRDDANREMTITVMAFNIPTPSEIGPKIRRV